LGIHKIVENFQIQQLDIDTIQYLAIGRHVVWMLCDTKIVPIKGSSNPDCWNIMIQAQSVIKTQGNATPESSSIHNLHQIESKSELGLRATADKKLESIVGNSVALNQLNGRLPGLCMHIPRSGD
jgi:hypothetical protein